MNNKRLLSIKEASEYMGLGLNNTRILMDKINATRHLSKRRIAYDREVINQWLDSQKDELYLVLENDEKEN